MKPTSTNATHGQRRRDKQQAGRNHSAAREPAAGARLRDGSSWP